MYIKSNIFSGLRKILIYIINILPTCKRRILFESIEFGDNAKALYDKMDEMGITKKYNIIWIVKNIERYGELYPQIKFITLDDIMYKMFYRIFARYCFSTHNPVGLKYRKGQVRCFLTHGLSFKDTRNLYGDVDFFTDIICTSEFAGELRCKTFPGREDTMRVLGFPRNDVFFQKTNAKIRMGISEIDKLIVWMPTFKHHVSGVRNDSKNEKNDDSNFLCDAELLLLNEHLMQNHVFLMIKYHPGQDMRYVKNIAYSNIKTYVNQDLYEKNVNIYELLAESDALITDFSSVYVDYLLCDKMIGFDISGMEDYRLGFSVENPMEYMPGMKIGSMNDLLHFVDEVIKGKDPFDEERRRLKAKMHKYCDGESAVRIIKYFDL